MDEIETEVRRLRTLVGPSLAFYAAVTGKSRSTVSRVRNGTGETVEMSRGADGKVYAFAGARDLRVMLHHRLREEGLSLRAIAERSGCSPATVYRDLRDFRVEHDA